MIRGDFVKILIPFLALLQITSAKASLIGVLDSGTDLSHKDLSLKAWKNTKEKNGKVDVDGDGLPGDVLGFDFTTNSPIPFDPQYNNLITEDVKKFYLYYSHYETKQLTTDEMNWLNSHSKDDKFMNVVDFVGGYIHGTHVAGISAIGNPKAKILAFKMIPTVYQEISDAPEKPETPTKPNVGTNPGTNSPKVSLEQFKADLIDQAEGQVEDMISMHKILNFHKVDVVNESFGVGWKDAEKFISADFQDTFKREPTKSELLDLMNAYFKKLISAGPKMFTVAPNTVFCIAAGNDNSDNDAHADYPSSIKAENRIVVAATNGNSSLAEFSNFGANNVDVAAPGVAITSTAPTNTYIALSGTSQATPYVTNTIAQMKDINPALTARQIVAIVLGTVDVKPWLKGKVLSSGIVNRERAIKASELLKTNSLDQAILKSKSLVSDVPVSKSLDFRKVPALDFKFKFNRPSLLIKK